MRKKKTGLGVKGAFRVRIKDNGELVGDSGWHDNIVTVGGVSTILRLLSGLTGNYPAVGLVLGSGGSVAFANTDLPGGLDPAGGTVTVATAITTGASNAYHTLRYRGTFASGWNGATARTIDNIGLYDSDGYGGGEFFAGNTFASSPCATNQSVEVTYDIKMGGQV